MPSTAFYEIAKARWPGYQIIGDGSLAVLYHCNRRIELCTLPMLASVIVAERCGVQCNHLRNPEGGWHTVETIKPQRLRTITVLRDWTD